jgi:NYN domain
LRSPTFVYIDGWNLYYGAIKRSPYRWLDLYALSCGLLRGHSVERVKYFTARVDDRPEDLHQSQRQDTYIRALQTNPHVEVILGRFVTRTKSVRLAKPKGKRLYDDALITEEKGSDVKLATHLVWDAAHGNMKCALVISNDSDLQESIDMARNLNVTVITCNPHGGRTDQANHLHGDDRRNLRKKHLVDAQLPLVVIDADGKRIRRPKKWGAP